MVDLNLDDPAIIGARLRHQAEVDAVRVTAHAHQEMVEDDCSMDDVIFALSNAKVLENYPQRTHRTQRPIAPRIRSHREHQEHKEFFIPQ